MNAKIPMPGIELVTVSATIGSGKNGCCDGSAATARFNFSSFAMLRLRDGRVLVVDFSNHHIRVVTTDLRRVWTLDARFGHPSGLAQLPDGRVLVAEYSSHRIRLLSAELQEVSTPVGGVAEEFFRPTALAVLADGSVLVADSGRHRIRRLSADLERVSTVAGGEMGYRDGAAAQFCSPDGLAVLPDGSVLVADRDNNRIRLLSADLQHVTTVGGDGTYGCRDGAMVQALFCHPQGLTLLPDGRVLVAQDDRNIRVLSADLQRVSTLTLVGVEHAYAFAVLPDGRVLVAGDSRVRVLAGLAAANPKPAAKAKRIGAANPAAAAKRVCRGVASVHHLTNSMSE